MTVLPGWDTAVLGLERDGFLAGLVSWEAATVPLKLGLCVAITADILFGLSLL